MASQDTSSSSCETLVVEVKLPGTKSQSEIDLDVQPTYLRATTSQYKLGTFLPHRYARYPRNAALLNFAIAI